MPIRNLALAALPLFAAYAPPASAEWVLLPAHISIFSNSYASDVIRISNVPSPLANPAGCVDPDSYMVSSTLPRDAKSRIYATLLMAKALGKPVTAWVSGCESSRPAVESVILQ